MGASHVLIWWHYSLSQCSQMLGKIYKLLCSTAREVPAVTLPCRPQPYCIWPQEQSSKGKMTNIASPMPGTSHQYFDKALREQPTVKSISNYTLRYYHTAGEPLLHFNVPKVIR